MDPVAFVDALFPSGSWRREPSQPGPVWTLSAVGDTAPLYGVADRIRAGRPVFGDGVAEAVAADLMFVNFEMAIQPAESTEADHPGVWATPELAGPLMAPGFNVALLGNNHITDYGREGVRAAVDFCRQQGAEPVGAGMNVAEARRALVREVGGARVGILAFAQPEANGATAEQAGVAPLRSDAVLAGLERLRAEVDLVVLSLHEGYEFTRLPRLEFKHNCRRFADAGADVILGHHPHVPQGLELHNGRLIFYSLGNFVFDIPYHREHEYTRKSCIWRLTFAGPELVGVELRPVRLDDDNQLVLMAGDERDRLLSYLHEISLELLDDEKVAAYNAEWVDQRLLPAILRAIFNLGANKDEDGYRQFLDRQMRRCDPYLKGMKDFVRYRLRGEPLDRF